jgi:hypothetical protein
MLALTMTLLYYGSDKMRREDEPPEALGDEL